MLGARAWQANPRYGKVPSINSFQISPTLLGKGELKDFFNYLTLQYLLAVHLCQENGERA